MALSDSEDEYEGDISNFVFDSDPLFKTLEDEIDEGKVTESRIKKFEKNLNENAKKAEIVFLMMFCGERLLN